MIHYKPFTKPERKLLLLKIKYNLDYLFVKKLSNKIDNIKASWKKNNIT